MVVHDLAKIEARVRFSCPAPETNYYLIRFHMIDGEEKLIKGAIRGESSAFGQLYSHYQPKIYRFVYLKVGHREEAEDITHQVFLNAWQKIESYKFKELPFGAWVYRIARNRIIDHYRTKKNNLSLDGNELLRDSLKSDTKIDQEIDFSLNVEKIKTAIKSLKPEQQDVIVLRFIEELSIKEVSSIVKKSQIAVKLIQHRAVKDLKRIMEDK